MPLPVTVHAYGLDSDASGYRCYSTQCGLRDDYCSVLSAKSFCH